MILRVESTRSRSAKCSGQLTRQETPDIMTQSKIASLAAIIATARKTRVFPAFDSALACSTPQEAYQVQAETARLLGAKPAGWKVGQFPDGRGWGAPVLDCDTLTSGEAFAFSGDLRSVKVEAELALRLRHDMPVRNGKPYSRAELLEACSEIFAGIELVGVRFADPESLAFESRLADNFANTAYIVSGGASDFASLDIPNLRCILQQDGKTISNRHGGHMSGDPLTPALAFINTGGDAFGGVRAGQFITTGTLTNPYDLASNAQLDVQIEHIGTVRGFTKTS